MPKEVEEDEGPSQDWLASYADAMTLLMAFFIMMFAFALVDEAKFWDLKVGVVAALGVPDPVTDNTDSILGSGSGITPEISLSAVPSSAIEQKLREDIEELAEEGVVTLENISELKELLELQIESIGAADFVEVGIDERGVFIRFDGQVLFRSGSAEMSEDSLPLLAAASDIIGVITNPIEIEGHTDSVPTGGRWSSNWSLSGARASSVVEWMISDGGLPGPQLAAMGRADTRPRASNDTEEGRALNRRVEIVVRVDGVVDAAGRVAEGVDVLDPIGDNPADIGESETLAERVEGDTTNDSDQ